MHLRADLAGHPHLAAAGCRSRARSTLAPQDVTEENPLARGACDPPLQQREPTGSRRAAGDEKDSAGTGTRSGRTCGTTARRCRWRGAAARTCSSSRATSTSSARPGAHPACPFFGHPAPPAPCPCPLRQAWGSFDALVGRLRAAYEEDGGRPENNPFGARAVRLYLREVRDHQSRARGVSYEKKKRKKAPAHPVPAAVISSSSHDGNGHSHHYEHQMPPPPPPGAAA
ncbi:hypothetical protein C2845_PM01G39830 [Panicum miliaceum]|uniref:ALOG domain-containing protein n=1 Tax=Panicum miliaceum TaxID=4540 RepID=A0A3L6TS33_PANMI|nr:hypothetical protein C2845_PM01G39830 [Panicum miliaceum]